MKLEINLNHIQQIAQLKRNENLSFGTFLKGQDVDKVDAIVYHLDKEITPQIECIACGNCCMNLRPVATIEELSKFVVKENIEKYGELPNGVGLYTWDWNEKAIKLGAEDLPTYGVIAQDARQYVPDAVWMGDDGYLRVDYSKVNV